MIVRYPSVLSDPFDDSCSSVNTTGVIVSLYGYHDLVLYHTNPMSLLDNQYE